MEHIIDSPQSRWARVKGEAGALSLLALPVVIDQVGTMSMGVVDTVMVGRLGEQALSAVGMSIAIYYFYMVFSFGVIAAVTPTVAQAYGRGDPHDIQRSTGQAFWIAIVLWIVGTVVMEFIGPILQLLKQPADVIPLAEEYSKALRLGMLPSLLYTVLRSYTTGLGRTRVSMIIALIASAANVGVVYTLVYGALGIPPLGVKGAGYATAFAQLLMMVLMVLAIRSDRELRDYKITAGVWPIDFSRVGQLIRLGVPIGAGNSMEQGVFALTSLLMGQIGELQQASHQVAMSVAALTFMVSLGISTATTTRVGQAIGRGDTARATLGGWVGIAMAMCVTLCTAAIFILLPGPIIGLYVADKPDLLKYASGLLMIAGAFQLADGIQVTAQGALRGVKDTVWPMIVNLVAYWAVGLPLGWLLAFKLDMGGHGLWWGLTIGLIVAATLHTVRFRSLTRRLMVEGD